MPLNYLVYLFYIIYEMDYLSSLGLNSIIFVCVHERLIWGCVFSFELRVTLERVFLCGSHVCFSLRASASRSVVFASFRCFRDIRSLEPILYNIPT